MTATLSPSTIRSVSIKPFISRTFIWKKACSASIATLPRTITAPAKSYGEPRAAVEIDCVDCHGTIRQKATLLTSGPAAPEPAHPGEPRGRQLEVLRTPSGLRRFEWRGDKLFQRSMTDPDVEWEIVQTMDTVTPGNPHFSKKSYRAKLMNKDGYALGTLPPTIRNSPIGNSSMTCYACHTSWTPTCFGCHLQMTANVRRPMIHNEGLTTRNYTSYNFQVLRDDAYFLGVDGTVTGHRIAPARSSCAVLVSSQNANREWLYYTQQTISAEGFSGQAFSTFVPHTVRAKETQAVRRLPRQRRERQQRLDGSTPSPGHQFHEFLGSLCLRGHGQQRF